MPGIWEIFHEGSETKFIYKRNYVDNPEKLYENNEMLYYLHVQPEIERLNRLNKEKEEEDERNRLMGEMFSLLEKIKNNEK